MFSEKTGRQILAAGLTVAVSGKREWGFKIAGQVAGISQKRWPPSTGISGRSSNAGHD